MRSVAPSLTYPAHATLVTEAVRCGDCGHERVLAHSCKGRGICPSCNTRRMAEVAAHVTDHVFPWLPVRQWVLSVPKRLRPYLHYKREVASGVLHPAPASPSPSPFPSSSSISPLPDQFED